MIATSWGTWKVRNDHTITTYTTSSPSETTSTEPDEEIVVYVSDQEPEWIAYGSNPIEEPEGKTHEQPEPLPVDYEMIDKAGEPLCGSPNIEHRELVKARAPPMENQDRLNMSDYAGTERVKVGRFYIDRSVR